MEVKEDHMPRTYVATRLKEGKQFTDPNWQGEIVEMRRNKNRGLAAQIRTAKHMAAEHPNSSVAVVMDCWNGYMFRLNNGYEVNR